MHIHIINTLNTPFFCLFIFNKLHSIIPTFLLFSYKLAHEFE